MSTKRTILTRILRRKTAVLILLVSSTFGAFATLGDGKDNPRKKSLLSRSQVTKTPSTFSLKSGYTYRGSHINNQQQQQGRYVMLRTVVNYQKGNTTYTLPIKRKVLLDKVNFNPAGNSNY